jgi:DNA-binding protein H-NS
LIALRKLLRISQQDRVKNFAVRSRQSWFYVFFRAALKLLTRKERLMSTNSISDIRKQLAALEKQEAKLLKKSRTAALKEIKALIKKNGLTAADITSVLPKPRRGRKPGPKPKADGTKAKAASGRGRGRPPKAKVATGKRRGRPPKVKAAE